MCDEISDLLFRLTEMVHMVSEQRPGNVYGRVGDRKNGIWIR